MYHSADSIYDLLVGEYSIYEQMIDYYKTNLKR